MIQEKIQKNFFGVVPATVRYDSKIQMGAKILYSEISALCNEKGFCWASNKHFVNLFSSEVENKKISLRTIQRWLKQLQDQKHIFISGKVQNRKIYIDERMIDFVKPKTPKVQVIKKPKKESEQKIFNWKNYLDAMHNHKARHVQVIALFFEEKNISFKNLETAQSAIRRHLKPAKEVSHFSDDEIVETIEKLKKEFPAFTVETIYKNLTK